ncbi:hypothetical protein [Cytobacillus oceanisediminis]|uniref:hypothetical protein n=1 Tax=Cytobacillus oceanisediminis TaxID=665099 RepID=UPI001FB1A3DC|nr:hypothetical protein [Cytobacillus oceanisediminis]UOE58045.1 hypothetical protein IRB79_27665 [Cytobacillus oceanisediminis]
MSLKQKEYESSYDEMKDNLAAFEKVTGMKAFIPSPKQLKKDRLQMGLLFAFATTINLVTMFVITIETF